MDDKSHQAIHQLKKPGRMYVVFQCYRGGPLRTKTCSDYPCDCPTKPPLREQNMK